MTMRKNMFRTAALSLAAAAALVTAMPAAAQAASKPAAAKPTAKHATTKAVPTQSCFAPTFQTTDTVWLNGGTPLYSGKSLTNKENTATLVMQGDGNLVLYLVTPISSLGPALWSSGTAGNPGAYAYMQTDGNFVIYNRDGGPSVGGAIWSTNTSGNPYTTAVLGADGNFQMISAGGTSLFQTHTAEDANAICQPTDPGIPANLPAGSWLESKTAWLLVQPDGNMVLYRRADGVALWSTNTSGSGPVHLRMQADGNMVLYRTEADGSELNAVWSSQTSTPGDYALLQDDTNFVVYGPNGGPTTGGALWSTNTAGK
jgi:hypothetical protein